MPARTINWTAATNTSFSTAGNWLDVATGVAALAGPATGDTLQFLDSTKTLPASELPDAGEVFALVMRSDVGASPWFGRVTDFLGSGTYSYSALTLSPGVLGDIEITVDKDSAVDGTVTATSTFTTTNIDMSLPNAIVSSVGQVIILTAATLAHTPTFSDVRDAGGAGLDVQSGSVLTLPAGMNLGGQLQASVPGGIIDSEIPILIIADTARIVWSGGNLTIHGGLNANGFTVTHTSTAGASLVCDQTGTLDLGGPAVGLAVTIGATGETITAAASISCGVLTLAAGTYIALVTHTCTGQTLYVTGTSTLLLEDAGLAVNITAGTCYLGYPIVCAAVHIAAGATLDGNTVNMTLAAGQRITGRGTLKNLTPSADVHVAPGVIDGGGNNAKVIFDRLPNIISTNAVGCGEIILMD